MTNLSDQQKGSFLAFVANVLSELSLKLSLEPNKIPAAIAIPSNKGRYFFLILMA